MAKKNFKNNFKGDKLNKVAGSASAITSSMLNKYANLNFSYYPGSPLLRDATKGNANHPNKFTTVPTLVKAKYVPTIGAFGDETISPINQASDQCFAKIRSDNAGAVNYASQDLMIFIMSNKDLHNFHAMGSRILGLINWYSSHDFNIPDEFYAACDIDIDSFRRNRVNFAAYLDNFALQANVFAIPNVFPIITDEVKLNANIYKLDESNEMGQYLFFEPSGFYRYEENVESGVNFGTLQWESLPNSLTYEEFVEFGDRLISDIKTSEDHVIMCGDIRKSFGSNLLTIDSIASDYKLEPVFDKLILDQFHNADIVNVTNVGPITQDGIHETITQTITAGGDDRSGIPELLDSVDWDPTPERVVELLRWKCIYDQDSTSPTYHHILANGPEIITSVTIWHKDIVSDLFIQMSLNQFYTIPATAAGAGAVASGATVLLNSAFNRTMIGNCLPFQYIINSNDQSKVTMIGKPRCATIVTKEQLQNVNRVKFYELLGIGTY